MTVAVNFVGNLFTSLEMFGVTLTLMQLDDELEACLRHPCRSVGLTVVGQGSVLPRARAAASANVVFTGADSNLIASPASPASPALPALPAVHAPRTVVGASVALARSGGVVRELITAIVANRQHLSEIDGLIGDGDHGINMAKGFTGCGLRLDALGPRADELPAALDELTHALLDDIGGSMGPLYGRFFAGLADSMRGHERLDAALFDEALIEAVKRVQAMGQAQVGDKTLIDALVPARDAFSAARRGGASFDAALDAMSTAAQQGRDATKAMQARIGRSARLGARSIGVLDAGATSCALILQTLATALRRQLTA
jgi:dihydroxyacetone kinase